MENSALNMVMISKEEYEELVETRARVNAAVAYITGDKYPDNKMICVLLGRKDAVEFLKKKGGQS